ncbi:MAG: hypothetical protein ACJAR2_002954 [Ilumatobacter sp.]
MWAAGLVRVSATTRAVEAVDLNEPADVMTDCFSDRPDHTGDDDRLTANLMERARTGRPLDAEGTAQRLFETMEAR